MIDPGTFNQQRTSRAMRHGSGCFEAPGDTAGVGADERLDALFLLNALSLGGSERKVVRLANDFAASSVRAALASLNGPETLAPLVHPSIERWCLNRRGKFSLRAVKALNAIVRRRRPRVLFTVNLYPALYAVAMAATLGKRAPPIIALINTTDFGPGRRWRQRFYAHVLSRVDALVYGSEVQREAWSSLSRRLRERAQVIYNGVDLQHFAPAALRTDRAALREECGYASDTLVIGSVGRLTHAKNHQVLIESVATLRGAGVDARLIIVGDGPLREELARMAQRQGVAEAVRLTGVLEDVRPIVATLDVFVLPSLYIETFSNAALEAMAMGTPVILSRIGGAAEMIRDGIEGFLVDPHALSDRLPVLLGQLAADRALRDRMAMRARERVERDFDVRNMVEQYASIVRRFAA